LGFLHTNPSFKIFCKEIVAEYEDKIRESNIDALKSE